MYHGHWVVASVKELKTKKKKEEDGDDSFAFQEETIRPGIS